jgi:hypothetical protein
MWNRIFIGGALLSLTCAARSVSAQPETKPVVFAHGYRADASTWTIVPQLVSAWYIRAYVPSGPRFAQYQTQGEVLRQDVGPDTIGLVGVGHSNGGIVLREARSQGLPLQALITAGTPHGGAPFAQNFAEGFVFSTATLFEVAILNPFIGLPTPHSWWAYATQNGLRLAALTWPIAYFAYLGQEHNADVLPQMYPNSTYRSTLLARPNPAGSPESEIPVRVAIKARAHDPTSGIIFAGGLPTQITALKRGVQTNIGIYFALAEYWSYRAARAHVYDPARAAMAAAPAKFVIGASAFAGLDRSWCRIIGTYQGPYFPCALSDGVVPTSLQGWTGAINLDITSLGHSYLTKDPAVASTIGDIGFTLAGVVRR